MIQVKGLTKIYKSRKGGTCVALDHISFTLPDRGFIFVVGKSGSGKTTLLSLLGGLDTITSGEIIENGRYINKFGLKEQVCYRNSTIGFIFQDFHLLDDLTIYENIALALELKGEDGDEKVLKALADTDLSEYKDRYPKELSGGQKQRVAIARALVKRPAVVLADEPTGNLDSKTTVQILDLLKELSKEKLVVIVSHNLSDAEHYADEILELSDGKILRHVGRNPAFDESLRIEDGALVIPYGEKFTDENLERVNRELGGGGIRAVRQESDRFLPYQAGEEGENPSAAALEKRHFKLKSTARLAAKFLRHGWFRTLLYAFLFAAILTVLGLSQLIMHFDGGEVLASEMAKRGLTCTSFVKNENPLYESTDTTRLVDVNEGDLQKFYDAGYEGKAYPLVNYSMCLKDDIIPVSQVKSSPQADPYNISGTFGVLVTEESYVEKLFGKLEYAAVAEEQKEYGIYLTDFSVDVAMIYRSSTVKSYQDMVGMFSVYTNHKYGYVNGIIDTGYKERYKDLLEKLNDSNVSRDEMKELAKTDEYLAFYDEVCQYLNIGYSFDPDFAEKSVMPQVRQFVGTGISAFEYGGKTFEWRETYYSYVGMRNDLPLGDNEIAMKYDVYNSIFGTNYTPQTLDRFQPHEVEFSYYLPCDEGRSQKKYAATIKIVAIRDQFVKCNIADNLMRDLQGAERFTFGYYFDNAEETGLLADVATANGFIPNSSIGGSITAMAKAVGVFSRFFDIIFIALCAVLFLMMVQFELKSIKDRMKEIGILKALGARDIDLVAIFGFQVLVAGLAMVALYLVGSVAVVGLANRVLVLSLIEFSKNTAVMNLSFLSVKWLYILQNCALALVIIVASFLAPMLRLRHIKPTNVIKAKE